MTALNGVEPEDRMAITKIVLKLLKKMAARVHRR
jgi:hypothetical protein